MQKELVQLYSEANKGKTIAAIGIIVRAVDANTIIYK